MRCMFSFHHHATCWRFFTLLKSSFCGACVELFNRKLQLKYIRSSESSRTLREATVCSDVLVFFFNKMQCFEDVRRELSFFWLLFLIPFYKQISSDFCIKNDVGCCHHINPHQFHVSSIMSKLLRLAVKTCSEKNSFLVNDVML